MDLILYGTSYKTAPVEIRERFSLSGDEIPDFLSKLRTFDGISEGLVLSTCNRTEIYTVCPNGNGEAKTKEVLHKYKNSDLTEDDKHFYTLKNMDAIRHLFRVSAGLESQMVGENQIKGQIKEAYSHACKIGTNGKYLNKLFHAAFRVGKKVRSSTDLGTGAVSISSAAVELAYHIYEDLSSKSALLIGAGETGELVVRRLLERGVKSLKIANRTKEKAELLAGRYQAEVADFGSLAREIFASDIVISATGSENHLIDAAAIESLIRKNRSKRIMIIDIAIPRDFDPEISRFENIYLYDMDDLEVVVEKNLKDRENEVPLAERIADEAAARFAV